MDRRVARSRTALQRALISLTLEKGYDAVTVGEICTAANVGRSTFYAHFTGKDDLKRRGLDHLRRELAERQSNARASGQPLGFSLAMLEHAREHLDLYRALAGSHGGAVAAEAIRHTIADLVRDELARDAGGPKADAVPRELVVAYVVGAFMAVLTWWLDGGARLPPVRIDAIFRRLATGGIRPPDRSIEF